MKKLLLLLVLATVLMSSTCSSPSVDETTENAQEVLIKDINTQTGLPAVTNGTMKKQLKMIIEECDKPRLICYAYTYSQVTGKYIFFGKCIGYGVPYATQYTNPQRISDSMAQGGYAILPQADPDGLFKPESSTATWLMLINPKNPDDIKPVYMEPDLIVSPFEL